MGRPQACGGVTRAAKAHGRCGAREGLRRAGVISCRAGDYCFICKDFRDLEKNPCFYLKKLAGEPVAEGHAETEQSEAGSPLPAECTGCFRESINHE